MECGWRVRKVGKHLREGALVTQTRGEDIKWPRKTNSHCQPNLLLVNSIESMKTDQGKQYTNPIYHVVAFSLWVHGESAKTTLISADVLHPRLGVVTNLEWEDAPWVAGGSCLMWINTGDREILVVESENAVCIDQSTKSCDTGIWTA